MYKKSILVAGIILGLLTVLPVTQAEAGSCGYQRCWGAVGFGPGGAWAYSHSYGSQRQAWQKVNSKCRGTCTVIKTFYNTCGAIAAGEDNGWGWASRSTRRNAENVAMQYCRRNSYDCRIRAWACSR